MAAPHEWISFLVCRCRVGGAPSGPALADGYYVAPTVLTGLTNDARCAREGIFGPVVTVIEWESGASMVCVSSRLGMSPGGGRLGHGVTGP
ncbi:aldehyde dehydrogenase family protein [Streptomyces afghaniensis]|uniref:aldehyde dehydrogenase family protein n=1 Tax=Streptomyces afghaniensis TaxID=66865 RepID=UPI0037BDCEF5